MLDITAAILLATLVGVACSSDSDPLDSKPALQRLNVDFAAIPTTSENQFEDKLFYEYGAEVEAGKYVAHPEFFVPRGSPVYAASSGSVRAIEPVEGPQDLNVLVRPDDASAWLIGYEHVDEVVVQVGDQVDTGDLIAIASPAHHPTLAKTAIMALFPEPGGPKNANTSYCPFLLLDEPAQTAVEEAILDHVAAWEADRGRDVFDESGWFSAGCRVEMMTEAESGSR